MAFFLNGNLSTYQILAFCANLERIFKLFGGIHKSKAQLFLFMGPKELSVIAVESNRPEDYGTVSLFFNDCTYIAVSNPLLLVPLFALLLALD